MDSLKKQMRKLPSGEYNIESQYNDAEIAQLDALLDEAYQLGKDDQKFDDDIEKHCSD